MGATFIVESWKYEPGKIKMSVFRSQLWLNIQTHKSTEEIKDKHEGQPEGNYSRGMVLVEMIGMPVSHHFIDRSVLDKPSVASETDNRFRACLFLR